MSGRVDLSPKTALCLAAPHTWPASVLPALFGELYCLYAGLPLTPGLAAALLLACILLQSGANTINDYYDYIKGTDSAGDCVEENDSILIYYHVDPRQVLLLGLGFLGCAGVLGLWVAARSGPAPLAVGVVGGLAVLLYSAGPCPLSYLPVGELVSGLVMGGLIPLGISAAALGTPDWEILPLAAPLVLGVGLIMMTNNACDIEKDRAAKRRTLPALLGRTRTRLLYRLMTAGWLVLAALLPPVRLGFAGLTAPAALALLAVRPFRALFRAPLTQDRRVAQMKGVLRANLMGNGAYLLAFAAALLWR